MRIFNYFLLFFCNKLIHKFWTNLLIKKNNNSKNYRPLFWLNWIINFWFLKMTKYSQIIQLKYTFSTYISIWSGLIKRNKLGYKYNPKHKKLYQFKKYFQNSTNNQNCFLLNSLNLFYLKGNFYLKKSISLHVKSTFTSYVGCGPTFGALSKNSKRGIFKNGKKKKNK